jgi:response regulator RpfG family c-di-GMP phosphodiesterase
MANILIVDSYFSIGLLYREVLEDQGHKVLVAKSGKEAIYLAPCERVDIVVVDDALPDYGAEELFVELKKYQPNIRGVLTISYTLGWQRNELLWDEIVYKSGNFLIFQEKIKKVSQDFELEFQSTQKEVRDTCRTESIQKSGHGEEPLITWQIQ